MIEIWKDIKGYEGLYEVSNLGQIKSFNYLRTGKEKILKPLKDKGGYLFVSLYKSGKVKLFKIHRLVAQAFIDNPKNKPCINHIDCDRQNNCVNNLEWVTQKENIQYAYKLERITSCKEKTPIIAINLVTGDEIYFNSQMEAARQLNLHQGNISDVLKGKLKRTGNYNFKYVNEDDLFKQ